jgi:hypothetical protein
MVIDTAVQVAKMCAFDTPPFSINFRHAMCTIPIDDEERVAAKAALHADIINEIKNIEAPFMKLRALRWPN